MPPKFKKHIFAALSATGVTDSIVATHGAGYPTDHTVEFAVTGGPSAATGRLEGSLNGSLWTDLSGTQDLVALAAAGFNSFHVTNKLVQKVRFRLLSLTGGTTPTVTPSYIGGIR